MQDIINKFLLETAIPKLKEQGCPIDLKIFYDDSSKSIYYIYSGDVDLEFILQKLDAPLDLINLIVVRLEETSEFFYLKFEKLKELSEEEEEEFDTWIPRINAHVRNCFTNILSEINSFIALNQPLKLSVPEKIKHNFKNISSGFKHIEKWKAKIIIGNNIGSRYEVKPEIGDFDDFGYVMINLQSGLCIPIARADEHHKGYDLLHEYMDQDLIPRGKYYALNETNYIYDISNEEERIEALTAFKLWRKMGGPNWIVQGGHRQHFSMTMDDYIKLDGKIIFYEDLGEQLYPVGSRIVDALEKVANGLRKIRSSQRFPEKRIFTITSDLFLDIKTHFQFSRISKEIEVLEQRFINAEGNEDINEVEQILFSHNGLKNIIHIKLKEALESESKYLNDYLIDVFGNIRYAVEEFDRLSSI